MHAYTRTCMHTHVHAYIHAFMYIIIHTYICLLFLFDSIYHYLHNYVCYVHAEICFTGAGQLQDIKNLSVCVDSDNNNLLVELKVCDLKF